MARRKRNSRTLRSAIERRDALETLTVTLDLGGTMTLPHYRTAIAQLDTLLADYNRLQATADELSLKVTAVEKELASLSGNMLAAVGVHYGKRSHEYRVAMAGARQTHKPSGAAPTSGPRCDRHAVTLTSPAPPPHAPRTPMRGASLFVAPPAAR